ncbi:hypothetical protein POTOM_013564 [Populus tomentosa]|uniref:Uncharacterized protein n=1 Tax=Populus tomentosa TaxID=118781 RepID=A0A8X8CYK2_POPTO|nr:hypothetical protein POTOM_013564 [Populus tomentosa]
MSTRTGTGIRVQTHVRKELADENVVEVETGDFPEEKDWYLVGGSLVTASSTTKGRKLVDNESSILVSLVLAPSTIDRALFDSLLKDLERLPMEWGKSVVPLVCSGKVIVRGRCVAAPENLQMLQDVVLYVSFYVHQSIFTELCISTWRLDAPSNIDPTAHPLATLFKLLDMKPYQKDPEEDAVMLHVVKRGSGCQQDQEKDEQAFSESSLNKLVGDGASMDPTCNLKPYQKQALYWMAESEKGNKAEKAAETLNPCWAAYRISDKRASSPSIYLNIFSGEATTQFPTASQMTKGGQDQAKEALTQKKRVNRIENPRTKKTMPKAKGGTLIICPMALLGQWKVILFPSCCLLCQDELETHSEPGSISIFVHYGGYKTNNPRIISGYDVVLTTYGVLTEAYKHDMENSIFNMG